MNHFQAFCKATPKNEHGYVPDLLDMDEDVKDQAVVATLRDTNNFEMADSYNLYSNGLKNEFYSSYEVVMQDEVDKFNQAIDDAKNAAKTEVYLFDPQYKWQHFNQSMFDAGMKPSDFC